MRGDLGDFLTDAARSSAEACLTLVANAGDWSRAELYGAAAGLIIVIGAIGLPWIEMAPDGAWRRSPPA